MGWHAVEEIDSAVDRTKSMLLPFDLGTWLRLAVIVIFTGAGVSLPNFPTGGTGGGGGGEYSNAAAGADQALGGVTSAPGLPAEATAAATAGTTSLLVLVGLVLLVLAAGIFLVSSVMELVFFRVVMDQDVKIIPNFRKHFHSGLSYFLFRAGVLIGALLLLGGGALALVASPLAGVLLFLVLVPIFVALAVALGLVNSLVVPHAVENGTSIFESIGERFSPLKSQWKEVGIFVLIRMVLKLVAGVANLVWLAVTLIVVGLVFGIPGFLLYSVAPALAIIPALLGVAAWMVLMLGIQVPIQTFMYSHALLVYEALE